MEICDNNKIISKSVLEFIQFVPDVNEESITDYLVWQWRKLDKRFNYLNIEKYSKEDENKKTGADFELELWLIKDNKPIPFVVQAKKFIKDYNSYCSKLNYKTKAKKRQIYILSNYAKTEKRLPFYLIYSKPDKDTRIICGGMKNNLFEEETSLYFADAYVIEQMSKDYKNKKLSKNEILEQSNSFCCLFCCPLTRHNNLHDYFSHYYSKALSEHSAIFDGENEIPIYVRQIMSNEINDNQIYGLIEEYRLNRFRNIGVMDLRNTNE
ncbi:MAG: hypothetical protein KJ799_03645 [Bacteroidetes bacterium]|nr:hypothetical protein [Bacteroidota bacterium]MBU1679450.1 hypothetical protein [Bacteroidota bacterium]MBU2505802.1 hypothetical protein [Bacteroidota bacterium]